MRSAARCRMGAAYGVALVGLAVLAMGCELPAGNAKVRGGGGPDIASAQSEAYNGPKARVAVTDFEDKIGGQGRGYWLPAYGTGLRDMLTTELFQTNRYIVLEREQLKAVLAEQDLGASGRIKRETAAPIGELEGAEILVKAAVTGFQPGTSGGGAQAGNLFGKAGSMLDSVAGSFDRATIAMDLRLIDTRTGRVLSATSVEGSATSIGGSASGSVLNRYGSLSGFAKTPMERAMRECMDKAVEWVVGQTPPTYFHFDGMTGQPLTPVKTGK
ncbi:hypothetical protein YTPLAS18_16270 [Nitrospira sp.]|nr:hypothetical protein YTPLAS18_16270 [Nitrospira sp.]